MSTPNDNNPQNTPPTSDTTIAKCKVKSLGFYSTQQYYRRKPSIEKYRSKFTTGEIFYLYWDLELANFQYKKSAAEVQLRVYCLELLTQRTMYDNTSTVALDVNNYLTVVKNSYGNADGSYWVPGQYIWHVVIDGVTEFSKTITIDNVSPVKSLSNEFFDLLDVQIFPSYNDYRENKEGYRYVQQLKADITEYMGVELLINRKFMDAKMLEFKMIVYNAHTGYNMCNEHMEVNFTAITEPRNEKIRLYFGAPDPGTWPIGEYLLYINYMDYNLVAKVFSSGTEEIAGPLKDLSTLSAPTPEQQLTSSATALSLDEALAELDKLVGMQSVKDEIRQNVEYLKFNQLRIAKGFKDDGRLNLHSVFTGNPGTGKTTVVRLLGKIYKAMGLLTQGHVIEATRADLVGEFIGQTAPKVMAQIEKARGGILFLDEAYALARNGDDKKDFGAEVIEILLKEMSDGPGNIAIVAAGYPNEINTFLQSNPGLQSRFSQRFHFEDYMPDELMQIADVALVKEEAHLDREARVLINKVLTEKYRNRDKSFANGRLAFGIIDEAKKNMGIRLLKKGNLDALSNEELSLITLEDIAKVFEVEKKKKLSLQVNDSELQQSLAELNDLVGLEQIKKELSDKINLVRFYAETGKDILNKFSLHSILTGNPGTGKTTLARLLGKIYKALGLLERGHVVEVDRQDLVAGYIGQTAIKTSEVLEKAMGGVLFIDEAYSLADDGSNDFGSEAVETLLKMMEDRRGEFAVIAAGYPDNMHQFIQSNPGLKSRFDVAYHLPDYTASELMTIAQNLLQKEHLTMTTEVSNHLNLYLNFAYEHRDKYFGNARFVRQTADSIIKKQHLRLAQLASGKRTPEVLDTITLSDVAHLVVSNEQKPTSIGFKKY